MLPRFLQRRNTRNLSTQVPVVLPSGDMLSVRLNLSISDAPAASATRLAQALQSLQASCRQKYHILRALEQEFFSENHLEVVKARVIEKQQRVANGESSEVVGPPVLPISMPRQLSVRSIGGQRRRIVSQSAMYAEPETIFRDGVQLDAMMHFDLRPAVHELPYLGMAAHYTHLTGLSRSISVTQCIVIPAGIRKQALNQLLRDNLKECLLEDDNEENINDVE